MFRDPLQKRLGEMEIKCPSPSLENVQPSLRERLESLKRYFSRVVEQVPQEYPRFLAEGWKEDWENYHPYLSRSACAYRAIEIAERRGLPERIVKGLQENLYAVLIDGGDKRFDSLGACIRSAIEVAQKYGLGDKAVRNAERRLSSL